MYRIPATQIEFSTQTRTFAKGVCSTIAGNIRNSASDILKTHSAQATTFASSAIEDLAQCVQCTIDTERAKLAIGREHKATCDALKLIDGEFVDSTDHPLVKATADVIAEAELVRKAQPDLAAADLGELREKLAELEAAQAQELETVNNRNDKAITASRKAFGATLARCKDVGAVKDLLDEYDTSFSKMLPQHWDIDVPKTPLGTATFDPAEKLHSPNRAASVVVQQCRNAVAADKRALQNRRKASKQMLKDATLAEIQDLLKEKS
jgi:hypothetical protein